MYDYSGPDFTARLMDLGFGGTIGGVCWEETRFQFQVIFSEA